MYLLREERDNEERYILLTHLLFNIGLDCKEHTLVTIS